MNPILVKVGGIEIRWYSVLILIAATIVLIMGTKEGHKFAFSSDFIFNLFFWSVLAGIVGARLYYVIFNWSTYQTDLKSILMIWNGGLAIHGAIIAGAGAAYLYCRHYKQSVLKVFDIFSVPMLLAQAIGRWGNFFNQEAHGTATSLANLRALHLPQFVIDGMKIRGIYYHPTFLYESLWCLLGFLILMVVRNLKSIKTGQQTCLYFMWYSLGRFFIEAMRTDSLMLGAYKVAHLVSVGLFLIGLVGLIIIGRKGKFEDLYHENQKIK